MEEREGRDQSDKIRTTVGRSGSDSVKGAEQTSRPDQNSSLGYRTMTNEHAVSTVCTATIGMDNEWTSQGGGERLKMYLSKLKRI